MDALRWTSPAAALLLTACAHGREAGPDPVAVRGAIAIAAERVQRCYRAPRVPFEAKQIVTRVRVRFNADGQPIGLPVLVSQESVTPSARPWANAVAQAAIAAVLRCAPLRLPVEVHRGGWDTFDLTFSPRGIA
jgi:hypothetical protein